MGRTILPLAFGVIGGFVGGLFTAGAFSSLGASIGFSIGGAVTAPKGPKSSFTAPSLLPDGGEVFIRQTAGTVGNIQARVIRVGKNSKGDLTGVFMKTKKSGGKGATTSEAQYFLMAEVEIGRAMGGFADSPEPLFIDKLEIEDADGRECIWDRFGATDDERGLTLVQTISDVTGRVIAETCDTVRFYTGTDEQMPDSAMAEFYPDGLCADRGIAKICFNRYPVKSAPTIYVTVRGENNNRRELLAAKFGDVGIESGRLVMDAIPSDSVFQGVHIETFTTTREFAERAARRLFCDWAFDGARLVVQSRLNPFIHEADYRRFGVWRDSEEADNQSGDGRLVLKARGATELSSEVRVGFSNSNQNYESDVAPAPQPRANWQNALQYDLGEVESMQNATRFAYALRDEDWNTDEQGQFSIMPGCENWLAGDVVRIDRGRAGSAGVEAASLPPRHYLLLEAERESSGVQNCSVAPWAAHVYTQTITVVGPVAPSPSVTKWGVPILLAYDGPVFEDRDPDCRERAYLVAFATTPSVDRWEGVGLLLGYGGDENSNAFGDISMRERATIGEVVGGFNGETTLTVKTIYGALLTASDSNLALGANLLAFESGLLLQFATATLSDYDPDTDATTYTLSGLRVGRYGSEPYIGAIAGGTRFALARNNIGAKAEGAAYFPLWSEHKGRSMRLTARVTGENPYELFTFAARNMDALRPTLESASRAGDGALKLSGRARWRGVSNNSKTTSDLIEISEPRFNAGFKYRIAIDAGPSFDVFTDDEQGSFDFTVSAAQLGAFTGESLTGTIAIYGKYGPGLTTPFEATL